MTNTPIIDNLWGHVKKSFERAGYNPVECAALQDAFNVGYMIGTSVVDAGTEQGFEVRLPDDIQKEVEIIKKRYIPDDGTEG